jgi:hypothetical protein
LRDKFENDPIRLKKELEAAAVLERHCTLVHIEIKNLDKWDSAR